MSDWTILADASATTNAVTPIYNMSDVDGIISVLNSLYGLPGHVLVGLTCIIFGYVLRFIRSFPNSGIPLACVLWGMVFNPLIADAATSSLRVWYVRNILIGAVIGAGAWAIHRWLFSRVEADIPILGDALATADAQSDQIAANKVESKAEAKQAVANSAAVNI